MRHRHAQTPDRHAALRRQHRFRFGQLAQHAGAGIIKCLAGIGQHQAARGALKQARAKACFQPGNAFTHRRAGEMQAPGGGGEAAAFHAGDEGRDPRRRSSDTGINSSCSLIL